MQKPRILLLGNRRKLVPMARLLTALFPQIACEFRPRSTQARGELAGSTTKFIIFFWESNSSREQFDEFVGLMNDLEYPPPKKPFLVVTEEDRPSVVHDVLNRGGVDCLTFPVIPERVKFLIENLVLPESGRTMSAPAAEPQIDYQSPAMRGLIKALRLTARSDSTILLTGETGTGKSHLARFMHLASPRRYQPLLTISCGAPSEQLIESELFGHVRGAFVGADRDVVGKLETVGTGTLVLDGIDNLPLNCQPRLLRSLEERVFERLGDSRTHKFRGRVIAVTNKSLETAVAEKRFSQDLHYQLDFLRFEVPPLGDRPEDVPGAVTFFLDQLNRRLATNVTSVSAAAEDALTKYSWPGNLRELRNVIQRAAAFADSLVLEPHHLDLPPLRPKEKSLPNPRLTQVRYKAERREVLRVLEHSGNNRTRAAKSLGISRAAFYKLLDKLNMA